MSVNMEFPLAGKVCVVTGASRGIGKGIALQLGEKGAKVYITGRTLEAQKGARFPGSLRETADEIEARGGTAVPVKCDHAQDADVKRLFELVERENDGQLDVLVNSAFQANGTLVENLGKTFWEQPVEVWDELNNVGLRNNYVCAVHASRLMVRRQRGLIVNVSSYGGFIPLFTPVYGVGKIGLDRMAADCAGELEKHNVAFVSIWPPSVSSETKMTLTEENLNNPEVLAFMGLSGTPDEVLKTMKSKESVELSGKCVAALAMDKDVMKKTGKTFMTFDMMKTYGLTELDGHDPFDFRKVNNLLAMSGYGKRAWLVPDFVRVPRWLLYLFSNRL